MLLRLVQGVCALTIAGSAAWMLFGLWVVLGRWPVAALDYRSTASLFVEDRHGEALSDRASRAPGGQDPSLLKPVPLSRIAPDMVRMILAAEDRRFFQHGGVDAQALLRAALLNLESGRIRAGGSTLTQQLARLLHPRPRASLRGKLRETAHAFRLEAHLSKSAILEAYLNRAPFGHGIFGVDAAARRYLGKPAAQLSLGEAATLATIPRAPSLFRPEPGAPLFMSRLLARRARLLASAAEAGLVDAERARRAASEPLVLLPVQSPFRAPRFVEWALEVARRETGVSDAGRVRTTLDWGLQKEARGALRQTLKELGATGARNGAVVVMDVPTGEILAYVASADYFDRKASGQVDGARARRSPGSALKPFVYGIAFERGDAPATIIADTPVSFHTPTGIFAPRNYDGRFHGPVSLRHALASSYNIPAVKLLHRHGVSALHERLRELGLSTLEQAPSHYGVGLALGDAEVRLLELVAAYGTLARGGEHLPPRAVRSVLDVSGRRARLERPVPKRVFGADVAALVSDVLRDRAARRPAFGDDSALDLDVDVAVKTGTSKDHRDVWTIGYTPEVVVGVWVGDMTGRPMTGLSGVAGAAPIFADVMQGALRRLRVGQPAWPRRTGLQRAPVCPRSGLRPGADCPTRTEESFLRGTVPSRDCDVHRAYLVDGRRRIFEVFPPELLKWSLDVGLPQPPVATGDGAGAIRIRHPRPDDEFAIDPTRAEVAQRLWLKAEVSSSSTARVQWFVDDRLIAEVGPPYSAPWDLERGAHTIEARAAGLPPSTVRVTVR